MCIYQGLFSTNTEFMWTSLYKTSVICFKCYLLFTLYVIMMQNSIHNESQLCFNQIISTESLWAQVVLTSQGIFKSNFNISQSKCVECTDYLISDKGQNTN